MADKIAFSPLTWYRKHLAGQLAPQFPGAPVPCGTCTACCERGRVVLYPPYDDPSTYGTETDARGVITLSRHPNGRCLYLHEGACLIYERRPMTCRLYDCRALLVTEVPHPREVFDRAHEKFDLVCKAPGDQQFFDDVRTAARIAAVQGKTPEQQIQTALAKA